MSFQNVSAILAATLDFSKKVFCAKLQQSKQEYN